MLTELDWFERSPLTPVLMKNKDRWIHFSEVPKIGVNPRSTWTMTGPYGIYLYPCSFLLQGNSRTREGQQFGTNYAYYFLADIDPAGGFNLSKVTDQQVAALAERNGFANYLQEWAEEVGGSSPGERLWKVLRRLNDHKVMSWNKALRGLSWVSDETGIMYGHLEPEQIVVLNPRALKNVTMGKNFDAGFKAMNNERDRFGVWKHACLSILKKLQEMHGGKIGWKEDKELRPYDAKRGGRSPALPFLTFSENERSFNIGAVVSRYGIGIRLTYRIGREEDSISIRDKEFRDGSIDQIVAQFEEKIQEVLAMEGDLRFKPLIDEDEAHMLIDGEIGQPLGSGYPWTFKTEISNAKSYEQVTHEGERSFTVDDVAIAETVVLRIRPDQISGSVFMRLRGQDFLHVSQYGDFNTSEAMMADLLNEFEEQLRGRERMFGPDASYRWPYHFEREDQWTAFLGWFVRNCGLSFGRQLRERFSTELEAYEAYEEKDDLHYKIERVFSKR